MGRSRGQRCSWATGHDTLAGTFIHIPEHVSLVSVLWMRPVRPGTESGLAQILREALGVSMSMVTWWAVWEKCRHHLLHRGQTLRLSKLMEPRLTLYPVGVCADVLATIDAVSRRARHLVSVTKLPAALRIRGEIGNLGEGDTMCRDPVE